MSVLSEAEKSIVRQLEYMIAEYIGFGSTRSAVDVLREFAAREGFKLDDQRIASEIAVIREAMAEKPIR